MKNQRNFVINFGEYREGEIGGTLVSNLENMENEKSKEHWYQLWRKMESSQGEMSMPKIICEIWEIKKPFIFEGKAPSIYRNRGVIGLFNKAQ